MRRMVNGLGVSALSEVAAKKIGKGRRRAHVKLSDRILRITYIGLLLAVLAVGGFLISTLVKGNEEPRTQAERNIVYYADLVKRDPKNIQSQMSLGEAYLATKNYSSALTAFNDALKINPKSSEIMAAIGATYQEMGEPDKAVKTMNAVLKVEPKNEIALWVVAKVEYDRGNFAKALDGLKKLEVASPANLDAYYLAGQIYEKQGNKAAAKAEYQKVLQFDPESDEAKSAILRLGLGK